MRILSNILWMLLGGIWLALFWAIAGLLLCITVVGIPLGVQCFKLARVSLLPYGTRVRLHFGEHPVANTLWAILLGWELALVFLVAAILNCITVIGIGRGIQCLKLTRLAFFPFGATVN